jgi:Na+-translocating ferredoxin:NAD+ oxidoreductase RnfC subunit
MVPAPDDGRSPSERADYYRARYVARNVRLEREAGERAAELAAKKAALADTRVSAVQAAVLRARAKKSGGVTDGGR